MKRVLLPVLAVAAFAVTMIVIGFTMEDELVSWNIYRGEISGYVVTIDEAHRSKSGVTRIVHMYSIEAREAGCTWGCGITGHDYDGTFTGTSDWDRIFRCGYPESSNGCNSVVFRYGESIWEPALSDAGDLGLEEVFREALPEAQRVLAQGMAEVYNSEHLISTLESWREEERRTSKS